MTTGRRQVAHVEVVVVHLDCTSLIPHFPDEPRGRVVIGKNATHLSRIHEHHGQ